MSTVLYYSPGSCSLAVHIVLHEIGEPFELKKFATSDRANYSPEYLAINPKGRIPTLEIDGFRLTENPAILAYLGRKFPKAGLYPSGGSEAEARCLELLAWSSNTAHVAFAQVMRPERFVLDRKDYPPVNESGRINYERCLDDMDKALQLHPYAVGGEFTVVDPFWLVFYRWGIRNGFAMKNKYRAFTDHAERLSKRPSVQRALATEEISLWS